MARPTLVERYRAFLPVGDATPVRSLGEGMTPLVHLRRIGGRLGLANLYAKIEGQNPTGSFKDRGMVVAVAKAVEDGARAIICASTGNTSASAAAYGAAHGLVVGVVLPAGKFATGKLLQAIVAGAKVVAIDGNFDAALRVVRALGEQDDHPITLVNSLNPHRLEGQKTGAFEVVDDLGRAPDVLAIPVGNAGNISAYWAGFREYAAAGLATSTGTTVGCTSVPSPRRRPHCGSFSPWPVTVSTTRAPAGTTPAAERSRRPATEIADAGSTKMPTSAERMRCASRILSSSMAPK
jgi:threonine synthase